MNKSKVLIMLDNGHGQNTKGKWSPLLENGQRLFEYEFNRDIVKRVKNELEYEGYRCYVVCPEMTDTSLSARVNRANAKYNEEKKKGNKSIFISIHANAAGNGGWYEARGWCAYTSKGQTAGDKLADKLYEAAHEILDYKNIKIREQKYQDGDPDYEENFYVLSKTNCPACLIENFFMDNKEDCKFILSDQGREIVKNIVVRGIKKYIESI